MTQQQIALLELAFVGGLGAVLFIAGILIKVFTDKKNSRCTSKTVGKVVRHSFMGDGRMAPVIEYEVGGAKYTCKKRFAGIKIVHSTRLDEPEAWEDEKGYLHVRTGILSNMRQLAGRESCRICVSSHRRYGLSGLRWRFTTIPMIRGKVTLMLRLTMPFWDMCFLLREQASLFLGSCCIFFMYKEK